MARVARRIRCRRAARRRSGYARRRRCGIAPQCRCRLTTRPASRKAASTTAWPASLERRDRQAHGGAAAAEPARAPTWSGAGLGSTNSAWCSAQQLHVQTRRLTRVAGDRGGAERLHRARRDVGGDADVPVAAEQHQRDGGAVVARNRSRSRAARARSAPPRADVAGRLLDADDAGHLGQPQRGLGLHVGDGARGHVVETIGMSTASAMARKCR